jgi:methyltransferase (TIGR00027 family)
MPVRPSITAEMVALIRAREQARAGAARIVDDPYSGRFLAAARSSWVDAEGRPLARAALVDAAFKLPWVGLSALVLARHRLMDQLVRDEAAAGARQLVVLGAGYDARAYRFAPPEGPARAFEVDHPTLSEAKRGYVRAALGVVPGHVRFVAVDFMKERLDERLLEEGFDPSARSVFVWEGVTYYLTPEAVRGTLATVRRLSAPGSTLVFDAWARPPGLRGALTEASRVASRGVGRVLDEPFLFALRAPAEALDLLREAGFDPLFLADAERLRDVLRASGRRLLYVPAYICVAAGRAPSGIP